MVKRSDKCNLVKNKHFCGSIPVYVNLFGQLKCKQFKFHMYSFSGPPTVFSHLSAELLPADQNKFSFFSTY